MVTKTQGVRLVRVWDTPIVLSHNERTSDEHGNIDVQEGLTSRRLITVRLRLLVATRLHKQLFPFQLCISSNVPSCSEES
jgi:hypothetical protein